jgi:hypothetical protein
MARHQFYYHEKGNHNETWHYLCKDEYGRAYVETETSAGQGAGMEIGEPHRRSVQEFLASGQGTAQENLLKLIATLIPGGSAR